MKISFKIPYRTQAGEQLGVMLEGLDAPLLLSTDDGEHWAGTYDVTLGGSVMVSYRYVVCRGAQVVRTELGRLPHCFRLSKQVGAHYMMSDSWRDLPYASYLFTSAFSAQEVEPAKPIAAQQSRGIVVRAYCPCISKKGQVLTMVGEGKLLGNWVPQKALQLTEVQPNIWHAVIDADDLADAGAYKFVALKRGSLEVAEWEGARTVASTCPISTAPCTATRRKWKCISPQRESAWQVPPSLCSHSVVRAVRVWATSAT